MAQIIAKTVNQILENCMKQTNMHVVSATQIRQFIKEPYSIYCNAFVSDKEKDPLNNYQNLLKDRGIEHESKFIEKEYPDTSSIEFTTLEEGFMKSLDAMNNGTKTILGSPLFFLPDGMRGITDVLERKKGKSSYFGAYHYIVKEIKLASNIKEEHVLQAAFYNHIIGKIQGYTPDIFYLINGDDEQLEYDFASYEDKLNSALIEIRKILNDKQITPTYDSCTWPWETYCNKKAIEINDISLVNGIGLAKKKKLIDNGLKTVNDLASCAESELTSLNGIGEITAKNFILQAKSLKDNKYQRKTSERISLPKSTTEIFLDLEGIDQNTTPDGVEVISMDYLIGVIVRKDGKENYIPFIAHNTDKEKEMLLEFLKFIKKQKDYIIYHWHHYEKTHLTKMMEKHSIDEKTAQLVLSSDVRIDLHKKATSMFVFPTYNASIKSIAKWMGFEWRHKEVNALESIVMYLDYTKNTKLNKDKLKRIQDYNEDDCKATLIIKDWLVQNG